jgi:hypothetical protein
MLEDELRAAFAARVATPPPVTDPAGRAIARARVIHRRRLGLTGLAVVAVMVLVVGGVWVVRDGRSGGAVPALVAAGTLSPSAVATLAAIRLDLRVGNEVWTPDGRRLSMPVSGAVSFAYRVPTGWVYGDTAGELRLLTSTGTAIDTRLTVSSLVVAQDGRQIAWSMGSADSRTVMVAELASDGVRKTAITPISDTVEPVTFVGSDLVLGRRDDSGQVAAYDVWDPTAGSFNPTWGTRIATVYGATGTGTLVGLTSEGPCLTYYHVAVKARLSRTGYGTCDGDLVPGSTHGSTSPDGRWVVDQTKQGVVFMDLAGGDPAVASATTLSQSKAADQGAAPLAQDGAAPPSASAKPVTGPATCAVQGRSAPVWENDSTVLVSTDVGVVRCSVTGSSQLIVIPGVTGKSWDLVPALGS